MKMENSEIIWKVKKNSIVNLIKQGKRPDGRKFNDFRKIELREGIIGKAEGSCWIKMGDTELIVGIKMNAGTPYPDSPDEGVLMTGAELAPIAYEDYFSGPPGEDAIELARVVDRGIRESKTIDVKQLCIEKGEKVWMVLVDIHVINYDGNLIDAATLATIKALYGAYIPKIENDKIIREKTNKKLPLTKTPIACTFAKVGGKNVLDPNMEEIKSMDSRITITTTEKGNICAMHKSGVGYYSISEISELTKIAIDKGKELRKLV
jgi:exosome complex component RRP42